MRPRAAASFTILCLLLAILFVVDLGVGSVSIPPARVWGALTGAETDPTVRGIVIDIRLVKALVALMAGMALSVSGLQMQTLFRNPMAGPYVLGITSGASLGVALYLLGAPLLGTYAGIVGGLGMAGAAWIGSAAVLVIMAAVSSRVKDIMVILILGIMVSSGVSAIVQILQYMSRDEALKSFVIWTMGSLGDVTSSRLMILCPAVGAGLILAIACVKPLNLLLFGEEYALTMGLDTRRARTLIFASTTLLAGTVTAFCGPIGFIGMAVPHIARMIVADADHRVLLPATLLTGGALMLLCDVVAKLAVIPVNSVTALVGIPTVVWVVMRNR
ncbi:MAG: iron ABC transporter permease [Muribaculaceae bacterium]|nr:iron ABC transporter permease [Muribaculaceae bacterium]